MNTAVCKVLSHCPPATRASLTICGTSTGDNSLGNNSDDRASLPKTGAPGSLSRKSVPPRLSSATSGAGSPEPNATRFSYAKFRDELVNRTAEAEVPRLTQEESGKHSPVHTTLQERARAFLETGELGSDARKAEIAAACPPSPATAAPPSTDQRQLAEDTEREERATERESFKEMERELLKLRRTVEIRETEMGAIVQELEEARAQWALTRSRSVAQVQHAQQRMEEKEMKLRAVEHTLSKLSELKQVRVEFWGGGSVVQLAGSFNGWQHFIDMAPDVTSAVARENGIRGPSLWCADVFLYPGEYQVKFLVDGRWTADPRRSVLSADVVSNDRLKLPPLEVSAERGLDPSALQAVPDVGLYPLTVPIGLEGPRRQ